MPIAIDDVVLEEKVFALRALPVRATTRLLAHFARRRLSGATKVHLGCGQNVLSGWANLDIGGGPGVTSFDLTRPLPFETGSVDRVFSEHFIEHVRLKTGNAILAECARILRPGGVLRISTPDLRTLVDEYLAGRTQEWTDVGWKPSSGAQLLNEGMRLWGHRFIWDEQELTDSLRLAGFSSAVRVHWRESHHADLVGLECRPYHRDLIVEATR